MLLSTLASSLPWIPTERRWRPRIPHAVHGILAGNLFPSEEDISQAMSISPEDLQITYTSLFRCMCRMDDFYQGSPENLKRFHKLVWAKMMKENFALMIQVLDVIIDVHTSCSQSTGDISEKFRKTREQYESILLDKNHPFDTYT